jgi:hypothetical protein
MLRGRNRVVSSLEAGSVHSIKSILKKKSRSPTANSNQEDGSRPRSTSINKNMSNTAPQFATNFAVAHKKTLSDTLVANATSAMDAPTSALERLTQ